MDRFRYSIMSYTFARERILNNNSLDSFEKDPIYANKLDKLYQDRSISIEGDMISLKSSSPSILEPLVSLTKKMDSQKFCKYIIDDQT
jgi:hypothetical protein